MESYLAHVRSPGGETGCQRHLVMGHVNAALHISPFFYFFAERQLPQKAKIEVALPKVETLKWAYTESAPRFMTPGTYPACPLPFFCEREYTAGNPYAGRHISQRGPFSVRCSLARQPSGLAKPNTPPCAMDHCPRGAGAGWHKPYCSSIENHTSVEAPVLGQPTLVQ